MSLITRGALSAANTYVWDVATLSWVPLQQPVKHVTATQGSSNGTAITTATDTSVVSAPSAGNHLRIFRLMASNSSATATWVTWRDGVAGTKRYAAYLPQNGIVSLRLDGMWKLTTATALYVNTTGAGNVEWHVDYITEAD